MAGINNWEHIDTWALFTHILDSFCDDDLVCLWNDVCVHHNTLDEQLYSMSDLDFHFDGLSVEQILRSLDSDFNVDHKWFYETFNGLHSTDNIRDKIDIDTLAMIVSVDRLHFGNETLSTVWDVIDFCENEEI